MSTHKYFDRICCVILAATLILTVLFMNAESFGIEKASTVMGYENRLFDASKVHTINIVMDDWDGFIDTCTNEEYVECAVVIDGDAYKNVAIRAKGNTSLSSVEKNGGVRYSFKIEFDHYDNANTYYGLDKLNLNNIIQDNTYMKDFLTYQMMGYFDVSAPLCSYTQILVNGEEWGLYLAVEGVEDSFLQRNYGKDYGELYKPDSIGMGGGRGNGNDFDMDEWQENEQTVDEIMPTTTTAPNTTTNENPFAQGGFGNMQRPSGNGGLQGGQNMPGNTGGQGGAGRPGGNAGSAGDNITIEQIQNTLASLDETTLTSLAEFLGYAETAAMLSALETASDAETFLNGKTIMEFMQIIRGQGNAGGTVFPGGDMGGGMFPGGNMEDGMFPGGNNESGDNATGDAPANNRPGSMGGGMGGRGGSDVSLIYNGEAHDNYQNIFGNAKTDLTDADKDRLIASLKKLNENSDIDEVVNIEEVIRYFVVHNFVCNFDSYTGSMIHNYYLYEEDGQLSMIPWDYNLAFGGFGGSSDATSLVNYPIDTPVSGENVESRPMIAWIFESEEYTQAYHQYFAEFISLYFDSGYFANMIDNIKTMISPYVESDPTKFCTYDAFEKGIDTLKEFCLLRAESINGQLNGTIASTSQGQASSTLIDASSLSISAMGSMGGGAGGMGGNNRPGNTTQNGENVDGEQNGTMPQRPDGNAGGFGGVQGNFGGNIGGRFPNGNTEQVPNENQNEMQNRPQGDMNQATNRPGNRGEQTGNVSNTTSADSYILVGISCAVLLLGLAVAFCYKKRV